MKRKIVGLFIVLLTMTACGRKEEISEDWGTEVEESQLDTEADEVVDDEEIEEVSDAQSQSIYGTPVGTLDDMFSIDADGYGIDSYNANELSIAYLYNKYSDYCSYTYFYFDNYGNVYLADTSDIPMSDFRDGHCIFRGGKTYWLDENMQKVEVPFINEGDQIFAYNEDSTGETLWTVRKEDSFEGTEVYVTAWGLNGNIKMQFDTTDELFAGVSKTELYDDLIGGELLQYESDAIYVIRNLYIKGQKGTLIIDLSKQTTLYYDHGYNYYMRIRDGVPIVSHNGGQYFEMMDKDYNVVVSGSGSKGIANCGLIFLSGKEFTTGFYDYQGNLMIDLSQYTFSDVNPFFNDEGKSYVNLLNPDGVPYWGILNTDGSWEGEMLQGKATLIDDGLIEVDNYTENTTDIYDYEMNLRTDLVELSEQEKLWECRGKMENNGSHILDFEIKTADGTIYDKIYFVDANYESRYLGSYVEPNW